MAWQLGDITSLPRPNSFQRRPVKVAVQHLTIDGQHKEDVSATKEEFVLQWDYLTQTEVADLLAEYDKGEALAFSVSDGDLSIAETNVLMEIGARDYRTSGSEYRETLQITLTEVS